MSSVVCRGIHYIVFVSWNPGSVGPFAHTSTLYCHSVIDVHLKYMWWTIGTCDVKEMKPNKGNETRIKWKKPGNIDRTTFMLHNSGSGIYFS